MLQRLGPCLAEFRGGTQVDQVAGDGQMVRRMGRKVIQHGVRHLRHAGPLAPPRQKGQHLLARELAKRHGTGAQRKVKVGKMGEAENHAVVRDHPGLWCGLLVAALPAASIRA
jgi:hypothetical protein